MSDVLPLLLGALLAVGALAFVLYPLFFTEEEGRSGQPAAAPVADEGSAIRALREIEFDRATGKLSDADYAALRASYAESALIELRGAEAKGKGPASLDIEERVRAYRAARRTCARCGLRPEPDAAYCSTCGGYLDGNCPACGSPVAEPAAAFCSTCGAQLSLRFAASSVA